MKTIPCRLVLHAHPRLLLTVSHQQVYLVTLTEMFLPTLRKHALSPVTVPKNYADYPLTFAQGRYKKHNNKQLRALSTSEMELILFFTKLQQGVHTLKIEIEAAAFYDMLSSVAEG